MASFEKRDNGYWSFRIRIVEGGKLKYKRITHFGDDKNKPVFKTKKEAEQGFAEYTVSRLNTRIQSESDITVAQLYGEWKPGAKMRMKEGSYYDTCRKIDVHILPTFKNVRVRDITAKMLEQWQLSIDNYAYGQKRGLRGIFSGLLKYAEIHYNISNQFKQVPTFKDKDAPKEMQTWDMSEFLAFLAKISDPQYRAYFATLFYTGCRKGEAQALSWTNINFTRKTIYINKTLYRRSGTARSVYSLTTPKTAYSIRTISIPDCLITELQELKALNISGQFVFGGQTPIANTTLDRVKKNAITAANIKPIRTHDFRHSHASYLISHGISIVAVSRRLGHKSVEQTLKTYAHLMPQDDEKIIAVLDDIGKKQGSKKGSKNKNRTLK